MNLSSSAAIAILLVFLVGSVTSFQPTSFLGQPTHNAVKASCSPSSTTLSMVTTGPLNCRMIGIGSAAPKTVITNFDLENVVETSDEWITTRTGISERHVLLHDGDETIKTIATSAAAAALEMSEVPAEDIDLVIVATSTPDDMFGDSTSVAAALGCVNAVAFDLTAACSGFLFSSVVAGQFLQNEGNSYKNAIVVGADAMSRWINWDDRNSCILFGDGAGAAVYSADSDPNADKSTFGILGSSAHSNGLSYDKLTCGYKGSPKKVETPGEGSILSKGSYNQLAMDGKEVYKFATREVPTVINEALEAAGMTTDDVDWVLLHQANIRIMETVAKRLGMPMDKVITNLSKYGNTSAASIPLALDEAVRSGQVKKGDVIACAGFGAGLSWGSAIMKWG